ncbi:MAG: hypothetical protein V7754_19500 [Halioglobus sp.]
MGLPGLDEQIQGQAIDRGSLVHVDDDQADDVAVTGRHGDPHAFAPGIDGIGLADGVDVLGGDGHVREDSIAHPVSLSNGRFHDNRDTSGWRSSVGRAADL